MSSCLFGATFPSVNDLGIFHADTSLFSTTKPTISSIPCCYWLGTVKLACQISFQLNISLTSYWRSNSVWRTSFENLLNHTYTQWKQYWPERTLKADFLPLQKLLATVFFQKKLVKWYSQPWLWRQISIEKIICEWFQLWEEIRLNAAKLYYWLIFVWHLRRFSIITCNWKWFSSFWQYSSKNYIFCMLP